VEGANFDVRKHLLEYDDVLNQQRAKIYGMRERIFEKDDLSDDIREMLSEEIRRHVQAAEKAKEDPWKLMAWLEDIQPTLRFADGNARPSFPLRLVRDELLETGAAERAGRLVELAGEALDEETEHLCKAFDRQMDVFAERAEQAARGSRETMEMAWEGAEIEAREQGTDLTPRTLLDNVARATGIDAKAVPRELLAPERAGDLRRHLIEQAEEAAWSRAALQAGSWLQRRTGIAPEGGEADGDFEAAASRLRGRLDRILAERRTRILRQVEEQVRESGGQAADEHGLTRLLMSVTLRTHTVFDQRTHQRRAVSAAQFSWIHLAARLAAERYARIPDALVESIQEYLLETLEMMRVEWGRRIWVRAGEQTFAELPPDYQQSMRANIPGPWQELELDAPLRTWPDWARHKAVEMAGARVIAQAHRELMLGVVGQSWVEYLTSMEALRTSVGLEAYAQRDPLVQYKSRAFDLFQELMHQVRTGVVSRLFRMSLRTAPDGAGAPAAEMKQPAVPAAPGAAAEEPDKPKKKKKKRKRHKR
jgi:preprotein translocase subunit SecA